jgi:hypothetical protein
MADFIDRLPILAAVGFYFYQVHEGADEHKMFMAAAVTVVGLLLSRVWEELKRIRRLLETEGRTHEPR